jgi:hypothetical protein
MAVRSGSRAQQAREYRELWKRMESVSLFFQGKDEVHKSMHRIVRRLERAGIPYAVVGGMAVFLHHYRRTTNDVDILVSPEGLEEFRNKFVGKQYKTVEGRSRRFVDRNNDITIDLLVTGGFPGSGKRGPIAYPSPEEVSEVIGKVRVINLVTLIQLKLAARRYQDFADVVNLIRAHNLDESFLSNLHRTLRKDFIECLEEKRREDEYIARQG